MKSILKEKCKVINYSRSIILMNMTNLVRSEKSKNNNISKEFILINPKEINEFCLDKSNLIDLINLSSSLIHDFFPNSKIYLEYKVDPEYDNFDAIFAYIINRNSYEANNKIYNELLCEFIKLKDVFPSAYSYYYINVQEDDEFIKKYKFNQ